MVCSLRRTTLFFRTPVHRWKLIVLRDLTDAWNEMLIVPAIAILSIGATRMYRSLCDRGSFTEYASSGLPQFTSGAQNPAVQRRKANTHTPIHFASAAQLVGTRTTNGAPVFIPVDQIQVEFVPSGSFPGIVHENTKNKIMSNRGETV